MNGLSSRLLFPVLAALANGLQPWFVRHDALYRLLLADRLSGLRWRLGAWRAWASMRRAYRRVPAYRAHLDAAGGPPRRRLRDGLPDLTAVPETDKDGYVRRHPHAARCLDGRMPRRGVMIDESSGSSGAPTNWVRGPDERWTTMRMLQMSYRAALGRQPLFVINAFALGAWATGVNVTLSLADVRIIKSTGPDVDKIVDTILEFGPDHDYVVMGYPPFLKTLADSPRIDWARHRIRAVFGGEAMSESMRRYLLRSYTQVLGSYGASDLEINMAAESRFTIRLRQEMARNPLLRARLAEIRHGVLPSIFQYNPLACWMETNADGELVVTLNRPTTVAPKVRYNIHDLGHVARFEQVAAVLEELGLEDVVAETAPLRLPLLFLYGRSDLSVDYYGATVSPETVRAVLFEMEELAPRLESFRLFAREDEHHTTTMEVAIELAQGHDPDAVDTARVADELFDRLARANRDFHNAYRNTASNDQLPRVSVHARRSGPFAGPERIKREYVAGTMRYDAL